MPSLPNNNKLTYAVAAWGGITATACLIRYVKRRAILAREERVASEGGLMPHSQNAVAALSWRAKHTPEKLALEAADGAAQYTYQQYYEQVQQFGKALMAIQEKIKSKEQQLGVAVHAFNEPRWFFASLGAQAAEWTVSGIYLTNTYDQASHVLTTSHVKVLVLESEDLLETTYSKVLKDFPDLTVVLLQGGDDTGKFPGKDRVLSYAKFLDRAKGKGLKDPKDLSPDKVTSLVCI